MKSITAIVGMIMFFLFGCNKVSTPTTNHSSSLSKNESMMNHLQMDPVSYSLKEGSIISRTKNDQPKQTVVNNKETIMNGDMKYGSTYSFIFSQSRTNFYQPMPANC